nr:hypothetical protein [Tanacetum cinerariifolium]
HVRETTTTTTTQNTAGSVQVEETPVRIITGHAGVVQVKINPVRKIRCPAAIVQLDKLRKQSDIHEGGDDFVLSTQEYMKIVVVDVGEDEDFKGGSWVSAVDFVNANGGGIVNGCLGDIENYLKNGKLEQVVAIIKSCTPNAIGDLTVTLKDLSVLGNGSGVGGSGMLMEEEEIVKLMEEEELTDLELQVCSNVTHQEMIDEEALNLAFYEEARQARADQEWLEKCWKEAELDEEHERQLWGFYGTI